MTLGTGTILSCPRLLHPLYSVPSPFSSSAACSLPCSGCPLSPLALDLSLVIRVLQWPCPACFVPVSYSPDSVVQEERQHQSDSHMARHLREPAGVLEPPGHEVVGECAAWAVSCVSARMLGWDGAVEWPRCEPRQIFSLEALEICVRINNTDTVPRQPSF